MILLHLGMPRTATTFLQSEVFPKFENTYLVNQPYYWEIFDNTRLNIISDETLCINEKRFEILKNLKAKFPDAKVLMGLRNYTKVKKQLYNHYLQCGAVTRYRDWEKTLPADMETYIEKVKELFPNFYFYDFEEFKKDKKRIIEDICEFLQIPVPEYTDKIINPSSNPDAQEHAFRYNQLVITAYNPDGFIPRQFVNGIIDIEKDEQNYFWIYTLTINHPYMKPNNRIFLYDFNIKDNTIKFAVSKKVKP